MPPRIKLKVAHLIVIPLAKKFISLNLKATKFSQDFLYIMALRNTVKVISTSTPVFPRKFIFTSSNMFIWNCVHLLCTAYFPLCCFFIFFLWFVSAPINFWRIFHWIDCFPWNVLKSAAVVLPLPKEYCFT